MKLSKFTCLMAALSGLTAMGETVTGPDGNLTVSVDAVNGTPTYSVTFHGATILEQSPLGFISNIGDFSKGMTLTKVEPGSVTKSFDQDKIKKSHIDYNANTLTTTYTSADGLKMSIEWQVANNDIAFRYIIPTQGESRSMVINSEATGFKFPSYTTVFMTPQSDAMIGWKRTKPSYEEYYITDAPLGTASEYGKGFTFPALMKVGDNGWVLLTETDVDGYFCGSRLSDCVNDTYTIAYPMAEENNGNGTAAPGIALPGKTPWRTITVGSDLAPIVETTAPWNVVEPRYTTATPARAGKGTWSWLLWQDKSINTADQIAFVDLAAEMGYQNVLIDNWWDKNIGREGMKELINYARSKNVNVILWYSSSGHWNDIEQSPVNHMDRPIVRKQEMAWLKEVGVKNIKVDFFGGDKQETMRLYEDILSDAADYGIDVIFHGCTLPRGWERMYPNYVGSEAVLASENLVFRQEFCDLEAFHATLHPFIRNAAAIMEYGGSVLNKHFSRDNQSGTERRTGDAFELATAVLFQNPVQNFALAPNNLTDAPADAISFMKEVPTTWDDVKYLAGYPGKYAVLARRHGSTWYIAGVNAQAETQTVTLDLSALNLNGNTLTMWADRKGKTLKAESLKAKNLGKVKIAIEPNGGVVLRGE